MGYVNDNNMGKTPKKPEKTPVDFLRPEKAIFSISNQPGLTKRKPNLSELGLPLTKTNLSELGR